MRIALVHPYSWPQVLRGGERIFHDLGWYLASAGHEVDLITGSWEGSSVDQVEGVVVRRHQLHQPDWLHRRGIGPMETFGATAVAALLRRRYDLVHALTPSGVLAARVTGHRCVYTVLGHPSEEDFADQPGAIGLFRAALAQADATVTLSDSAADRVGAIAAGSRRGTWMATARRNRRLMRGQGPGNWLQVIQPGVRLDRFVPDLEPRTGEVRVLFASDASEIRKGVHHALAAVDRLRRIHPGARLVLACPGNADWAVDGIGEAASATMARRDPLAVTGLGEVGRRALDEATDVVGPVAPADMPEWYRRATVTVLPSWEEAFGLVLAESLACGTPAVAYHEAGMREIISRPEVGRTARFGDIADLTRALDEAVVLARDPKTPALCADHARRWDWTETVGPAHEELYHSILGR